MHSLKKTIYVTTRNIAINLVYQQSHSNHRIITTVHFTGLTLNAGVCIGKKKAKGSIVKLHSAKPQLYIP